jgi:putative transposase
LYRFRELLSYKQECFGFLLTIVDRWFPSSKTCSVCGNIQDMPLCERVYHCQDCGQVMDRDLNASINLERWMNNADGLSVNPERLVLSEVEGSRRVNACGQDGAVSLG